MNFIHEQFNQYFTQKYSDQNCKFASFFFKILHLTQQIYYELLQIRVSTSIYDLFSLRQMADFL